MSKGQSASQIEYGLPPELDLLAAESLKEKLVDFLHQEVGLIVDGSDVARISTPCIEVLFAAGTAFTEAEQAFQITNPSQYMNDALEALGLSDHFQRWRAS
ncbi:MAG: STAS domain-containing protein [Kordiimonadaceae bacterium]|nr:STAS domain-containing protein [Kordiimonadaceae bacterium]